MRTYRLASALCVLFLAACSGTGDPAAQAVQFPSSSFQGFGNLTAHQPSGSVTIQGTLAFPPGAQGPVPAVVLGETCGGYRDSNEGWHAEQLRKAGYATLTFSSLRARNVSSYCTNSPPVPWASLTADGFAALSFLAENPRIDRRRIAIIGFSMGGELARLTAFEPLRQALVPSDLRYAAHVAFYPAGVFGMPADKGSYTGAPVLWMRGEREQDLVPEAKIAGYWAYWQKSGIALAERRIDYAGAYHSWTDPIFIPAKSFDASATARNCPMRLLAGNLALVGSEAKSADEVPFQGCVARGYWQGFDGTTRAKSLADLLAFLRETMG